MIATGVLPLRVAAYLPYAPRRGIRMHKHSSVDREARLSCLDHDAVGYISSRAGQGSVRKVPDPDVKGRPARDETALPGISKPVPYHKVIDVTKAWRVTSMHL